MGNLFAELKRRQIYRVAAAYAVVAWVLLQLVNNLAPGLNLPNWALTFVIVLLAVGFPIALVFAWIHELSPADGTTARTVTSKLDWALMGALVVVIALVSYQQFASTTVAGPARQQASVTTRAGNTAGISVAVLPFANLSSDKEQEFFSDGMTDEIMTALAKVSALQVVGRESAFQFKDRKIDMKSVGQALGATYLIEGSVRKAGDQVRITAQLVQANNGVSLWTDSYDRELKNIFATQSDIAQAIAAALRVPLGLKQGNTLVSNRTNDLDSYQKYLQAKELIRARRGGKPLTDAITLLEQVIARDPDYAPGLALLALAYNEAPIGSPAYFGGAVDEIRRVVDVSFPKAEAVARRAIQLDPNLADGYLALGLVQRDRGKLLQSEDLFKQALALDPDNPDALHWYSDMLAEVGRVKETLPIRRRLEMLEPFVPIFNMSTAFHLSLNGQDDDAIAILKTVPPALGADGLAVSYAVMGRYSEAADTLLTIPSGIFPPGMVDDAARILRTAPAVAASPQTLPPLGLLGWVYLYVGAPGRVLEYIEALLEAGDAGVMPATLWLPQYAPLRKTERFKAVVRKAGLVDYWRSKGWPEFCHPTNADDFVCD